MPTDASPNHTQELKEIPAPQEDRTAPSQSADQDWSVQDQMPSRQPSGESGPPSAHPAQPSPSSPSSQQWTLLQQWTSPEGTPPPLQWSSPQPLPIPEQGRSGSGQPAPAARQQPQADASAPAQPPKSDAAAAPEKGSDGQDKPPLDRPKDDSTKDDSTKGDAKKGDAKKDDPTKDDPKKDESKDGAKEDDPKAGAAAKAKKWIKTAAGVAIVLILVGGGFLLWEILRPKGLGPGFASGNGRIEATELFVASKVAGRISNMYVDDGDSVTSGQIVATIDSDVLQTELQKTKAEQAQARNAVATALAVVGQHQSEKVADEALVAQRYSELHGAIDTAHRSQVLSEQHAMSIQEHENDVTSVKQSEAKVASAEAQVVAAQATIVSSQSQVLEARSNLDAAIAQELHLKTQIDEDNLRTARPGRVQFRITQPGEVVDAGGKVLSMADLSDVTMTFFLPEASTGKISLGSEARIVLDADPSFIIPATVSFVGSVAQFTPKTVETEIERQKLVFRIKARIDPNLLTDHLAQVKSGLPGVAYVRLDPSAPWPDNLKLARSAP